MNKQRDFRIYDQKFNQSLKTAHGIWSGRKSIILREENEEGQVCFGEASPTPGFSSSPLSTLIAEAVAWSAGKSFDHSPLFRSALSCLSCELWDSGEFFSCQPVHSAVLHAPSIPGIPLVWKRKIGLLPADQEILQVLDWISGLPADAKVRLDANESLNLDSLRLWVNALEGESKLEFFEQPLPRKQFNEILAYSKETAIPFALDESVVSLGGAGLLRQQGWLGYYVIKPSLLTNWEQTLDFIKTEPERSIVSTVFESPFGYEAVSRCASLAKTTAGLDRSLFAGQPFEFAEHHQSPLLPFSVGIDQFDQLWERLR